MGLDGPKRQPERGDQGAQGLGPIFLGPTMDELLRSRLRKKHRQRSQRPLFGQIGVSFWDAADFLYLEDLLAAFGHWTTIVELGTCLGGTSVWLGVAAGLRGGEVHTFDILRPGAWFNKHAPPNVHFHELDILECARPEIVDLLRYEDGRLLICDAAEKHEEMDLYGCYLNPGCGLIVDDYGIRGTSRRECDRIAAGFGLKPWRWDLAEAYTAKIRAWVACEPGREAASYEQAVHTPRRTSRQRRAEAAEKGIADWLGRGPERRRNRRGEIK